MQKLNGLKTYIAAAGLILTALAAFLSGDCSILEFVTTIFTGLGIAGVRHGISSN